MSWDAGGGAGDWDSGAYTYNENKTRPVSCYVRYWQYKGGGGFKPSEDFNPNGFEAADGDGDGAAPANDGNCRK